MNPHKNLVIKNLSKTFADSDGNPISILKDISLEIPKGKIVSIIGPSGCGKSTLLDCISGLLTPDAGEILYEEKSLIGKKEVSYMTQNAAMLPWRRVLDNLALSLEMKGISSHRAKEEAMGLLKEFNLSQWADYYPNALSGGMLQRVSLLRAYLSKRDIMLLDEPFSRLDALTKIQIQEWFLEVWQKHKKTIVFVTHDIEEALFISDYVYVFSKRPSRILQEIYISFSRPREISLSTKKEFLQLKNKILKLLL